MPKHHRIFTILVISLAVLATLLLAACNTQLKGRPDGPASINGDFRSDPPKVIARTGRPQLIELWAHW